MTVFSGWASLRHARDMAPYSEFYQEQVRRVANRNGAQATIVVEAGVRYGCSARIMAEALSERSAWHLHLIDPWPKEEALQLQFNNHISFHQAPAERIASQFADHSIDLLHIDADIDGSHPYALSYNILIALWNKVKPNGTVIFHDCTESFPGITRLVNELKASGWAVVHAKPASECPISAPAAALRAVDRTAADDITVVVPIIQDMWLGTLLSGIRDNDVQPTEIIVIDNGAKQASRTIAAFPELNVTYLKQDQNIGVNASWNLGIERAQTELVAILNDDLVLPTGFFSAVQDTFRCYPRAGFVIPTTIAPQLRLGGRAPWRVGGPSEIGVDGGPPEVQPMMMRDGGWAMTVRKSLMRPIPPDMFTFCGDDFIFRQVAAQDYWTLKMTKCRIYHHVGISQDIEQRKKLSLPSLRSDQAAWHRIRDGA